jgi:hypothetical protein
MRAVYRVLAWLVAAEVVVQAAAVAYGVFGLAKWVEGGGVLDKAVMESDTPAFPEVAGFAVHGINGMMIVPALALLLLVVSFFARVRRGVAAAGAVAGLVAVQVLLGMLAHGIPGLGILHGATALLLLAAAVYAARRPAALPAAVEPGVPSSRHGAVSPL